MKMRHWMGILALALLILVGCGSDGGSASRIDQSNGVSDVLTSQMEAADAAAQTLDQMRGGTTTGKEQEAEETQETGDAQAANGEAQETGGAQADSDAQAVANGGSTGDGSVDVDLTTLSSTMVYSEVYNMMVSPDAYVGKTIRMSGLMSIFLDEATEKYYYACIIQDATACCAQGIEFEPT
nr:hypothetical protein [Lachnospiraceae bacterium]